MLYCHTTFLSGVISKMMPGAPAQISVPQKSRVDSRQYTAGQETVDSKPAEGYKFSQ
jgi:hypothetical protein